jgi:hypothetical protein
MTNSDSRQTGNSWPSEDHDEFLALCAISTSGQLSRKNQEKLDAHLAECGECRAARREFDVVVSQAIPALIAEEAAESDQQPDSSWSLEKAEARLFREIKKRQNTESQPTADFTAFRHPLPFDTSSTWRHIWMLSAAAILLTIALGVSAYRFGIQRGLSTEAVKSQSAERASLELERRLGAATQEYDAAKEELAQRDRLITKLKHDLNRKSADIDTLSSNQRQLADDLHSQESIRQKLTLDRDDLTQQLTAAEDRRNGLQAQLVSAEEHASRTADRVAALEANLNDLRNSIAEREKTIEEQRELLAHDRDIRELMGARDLYITEVYDVADTGATKKPFGRVFYTRGKSLVFYAYDLDQQAEVKNASAFQAWGSRGGDRKQAMSLGIFYEDNSAKKRWVMRSADPKVLAQIDMVFVTVEPKRGSTKPSGNPLLFAYLRVDPNHP